MWSGSRVREEFIKFYQQKEHLHIPSSSVVPVDDPTLLFTNAGMNQFKPIFLGSNKDSLKRVVNSQKCIRAGGKHNDLDDVGKDNYHHTFFEMLGTWSFGDYFKEESIDWAWELLTQVYSLDPKRIYVSYFCGNEDQGLLPDLEVKKLWSKYLPEERILPFGMKENFWEMGETGPCGPCSEIHYDRIGSRNASSLVNRDDPTVIEIWNHVFIQFNRESSGKLNPLPMKHVDTGMGLERLTSILQEKMGNYDTDFFQDIFRKIEEIFQCRPYQGKFGSEDPDRIDMAYRVVADHIRTLTIAIGDGAVPSNTLRGYVIRKILRRAVRYSKQVLHAPYTKELSFLSQLVPTVIKMFSSVYRSLTEQSEHIISVIKQEELMFLKVLEKGTRKFNQLLPKLKTTTIPGQDAWRLYDTYGLPLDIIQMMTEERELTINLEEFEECRKKSVLISQKK